MTEHVDGTCKDVSTHGTETRVIELVGVATYELQVRVISAAELVHVV